jgi:hypothetical protein
MSKSKGQSSKSCERSALSNQLKPKHSKIPNRKSHHETTPVEWCCSRSNSTGQAKAGKHLSEIVLAQFHWAREKGQGSLSNRRLS